MIDTYQKNKKEMEIVTVGWVMKLVHISNWSLLCTVLETSQRIHYCQIIFTCRCVYRTGDCPMMSMHGKVTSTFFWNNTLIISQKGDRFPDLGQGAARRAAVKGDNNPFRFLYHLVRINPHPNMSKWTEMSLKPPIIRWQDVRSFPRGIFSVGKILIGSSTPVAAR